MKQGNSLSVEKLERCSRKRKTHHCAIMPFFSLGVLIHRNFSGFVQLVDFYADNFPRCVVNVTIHHATHKIRDEYASMCLS